MSQAEPRQLTGPIAALARENEDAVFAAVEAMSEEEALEMV